MIIYLDFVTAIDYERLEILTFNNGGEGREFFTVLKGAAAMRSEKKIIS